MTQKAGESLRTIPLRKEWLKAPRGKRSKRAVTAIKSYLEKHFDASEIKVSQQLNEFIWTRGIEKPPGKVKVKISVTDKGVVTARLPEEVVLKEVEKKQKKNEKKSLKEKAEEKIAEKKTEKSVEKSKEEKPVENVETAENPKETKAIEPKKTEDAKDDSKVKKKGDMYV
ncbi:MAG: 50S ribosomal protein L31e [Candidatus Aenigmatarchaeota archaeon]